MPVLRAHVEQTKAFMIERDNANAPYVYGGSLSTDPRRGTDCSEIWQTALEMVHGRWVPGRQSEGATTESYRYIPVGGVGPFGTIRVARLADVPSDAVARLSFHHGPGGGANSHVWGDLDGLRIESAGSKGVVTGSRARPVEDGYANAWAYLPGPIVGVAGPPPPLGVGSTGAEVIALQQRLNTEGAGLDVDGEYGPATAAAVTAWDRRTGYARTVRDEGVRRGVTPRGIQIAFSVVFVESGWKNYANSKVPESMSIPHDAVGTDYDSVGLFQQRCPMWGPAHVLMNPALSAGLFYDRLVKLDYNNTSRPPGDYAADVQRPAKEYRGRYQERMGAAVALYNRLANNPPDELEELLMLKAKSWSIYATPGEPELPVVDMIRAIDAKVHRDLTDEDAKAGDPEAIRRIARTAGGLGDNRSAGAISHAVKVLNEINATNPQAILAAMPGKA
jgi:hypothetical protein